MRETKSISYGQADQIDSESWTINFAVPPGASHVAIVFDHGEKRVYIDGELSFLVDQKKSIEQESKTTWTIKGKDAPLYEHSCGWSGRRDELAFGINGRGRRCPRCSMPFEAPIREGIR